MTRVLAALLVLAAAVPALAEESFPDLNIEQLRAQAADYRHRAALLRKHVGIRDRGISEAESRANAAIQSAEADAQARAQAAAQAQANAANAQGAGDLAAFGLGFIPGGGWVKKAAQAGLRAGGEIAVANAQAQAQAAAAEGQDEITRAAKEAAPLREQAKALEGEKKRLALKADQYEKLADSKDFLAAAETLRKQAEEAVKTADQADKAIAAAKSMVRNMDLW